MPITVITGGTRGLGAAIAHTLAVEGHDLALCYQRDADAAAATVGAIREYGVRCIAVRAEVADPADVERLFAGVAEELGRITGLVNNAGITAFIGDLADTPVETIRHVVDANLLGTLLCSRRAVQSMAVSRGGGGGAIVNISSAAATLGSPHEYVSYAAAKAGVEAATVGLAKELAAEKIRVNAVAPGILHTDIHAAAGDPDRPERAAERIPWGRAGRTDEVAPAVAWLLGSGASYTTGAVLRIAGGL